MIARLCDLLSSKVRALTGLLGGPSPLEVNPLTVTAYSANSSSFSIKNQFCDVETIAREVPPEEL